MRISWKGETFMAKYNGFRVWDEELEQEFFSAEEIEAGNIRVALIGALIKARKEKGVSQRDLENMSGVKQPAIARMERGASSPTLDTLIKVLLPLGKTLSIVSLPKAKIRKMSLEKKRKAVISDK